MNTSSNPADKIYTFANRVETDGSAQTQPSHQHQDLHCLPFGSAAGILGWKGKKYQRERAILIKKVSKIKEIKQSMDAAIEHI